MKFFFCFIYWKGSTNWLAVNEAGAERPVRAWVSVQVPDLISLNNLLIITEKEDI